MSPSATPPVGQSLTFRGINYDTGTSYVPGWHSRPDWSDDVVRADLATIRDELHCNAVSVFGSDVDRLAVAASAAAGTGLHVWVQPRLVDARPAALLAHLAAVAEMAERLRTAGAPVRLNVGCELSIFASGIIPGSGYERRARRLGWAWPALPWFDRRLDRLLRRACAVARERFGGEVTYGAGSWETVDWRLFDAVGLNHYRDARNRRSYVATLQRAHQHAKPVLVTEFGCCSYRGADRRGAAGDAIVDWRDPAEPTIRGSHRRDEAVQARYITELLDCFDAAGVHGAFVFEFSEPAYPRAADARHDLDMASFGVVAVHRDETPHGVVHRTVPKAAFHEIARRYGGAG
ncbi:MAG TPA: hypothetical protein VFZ77_10405 [Acidimicrobiales bacterium]